MICNVNVKPFMYRIRRIDTEIFLENQCKVKVMQYTETGELIVRLLDIF